MQNLSFSGRTAAAMKAIFKPFFALCGLIALSTALSADSRVSVGGGAAGTGESGFLYSDYLRTASDEGRDVGFRGSFVVAERRTFLSALSEVGGGFSGRVLEEVQSLPLREWGLHALGGGIFEGERPAHRRALLERGWRLADWLADETLLAATEGGRASGFIRTFELDVRSELGGRRAQVGLNVLGALRERNDDAVAWQLRGFKSSKGTGGNAGLIYRRLAGDALAGANVFLDYETYSGDGFWRWSGGTEFRSEWVDVFGNVYKAISDEVEDGNVRIYTADGYELELNVHSPDVPWVTGEATYYSWEGKGSLKDDSGIRWGVKLAPWAGLEFGLEYENQDDSKKKSFAGRFSYRGALGGVDAGQSGGGVAFNARDWFFAPAEREYSQRIRKYEATNFQIVIEDSTPDSRLPIIVEGAGVGATINVGELPFTVVVPGETTVTISDNPNAPPGALPLVLTYPRTGGRVEIRSTVAFAIDSDRDFFRLVEGNANINVAGGTNAGLNFVAEQYADARNNPRFVLTTGHTLSIAVYANPTEVTVTLIRTIPVTTTMQSGAISISTITSAITLTTTTRIPPPQLRSGIQVGGMINGIVVQQQAGDDQLKANTVLAQGVSSETPPRLYAQTGGTEMVVATLEAMGGGGPASGYKWEKAVLDGGRLLINNNGVISIPASQAPTDAGNLLSVKAILTDDETVATPVGMLTEPLTIGFTVVYQTFQPLVVLTNLADGIVSGTPLVAYHPTGGLSLAVATLQATRGVGGYTWSGTGELQINNDGVVWIPASENAGNPGRVLTIRAILNDDPNHAATGITEPVTVDLTVSYEAQTGLSGAAVLANDPNLVATDTPPTYYAAAGGSDAIVATLQGRGGNRGSGYIWAKADANGGELLVARGGEVRIPASATPTDEGRTLSLRAILNDDDSVALGQNTPPVTLDFTVVYRLRLGLAARVELAQGVVPGSPPVTLRSQSGGAYTVTLTHDENGNLLSQPRTMVIDAPEQSNSYVIPATPPQTLTVVSRVERVLERVEQETRRVTEGTGRIIFVSVPVSVFSTRTVFATMTIAGRAAQTLATERSIIPGAPPTVLRERGGEAAVAATLRGIGGGGGHTWRAEPGGDLEVNLAGVVRVPASADPTEAGTLLTVRVILNDDPNHPVGRGTEPVTVDFAVLYRLSQASDRGVARLASYPLLSSRGGVPVFYRSEAAETALVAATLRSNRRSGGEFWSNRINKLTVGARQGQLPDGVLDVDADGVVLIPAGTEPTEAGKTMTLGAVLSYNLRFESYTLRAGTLAIRGMTLAFDQLTTGFTLSYRKIPSAGWEHATSGDPVSGNVTLAGGRVVPVPVRLTAWGLANSPAIALATAVMSDGSGIYAVDKVAGELDVSENRRVWAAVIPANTAPGGELTLEAGVRGVDGLPPRTARLTAAFNALTSLSVELQGTQAEFSQEVVRTLPDGSQVRYKVRGDEAPPSQLVDGVINVQHVTDPRYLSTLPNSYARLFELIPTGGAAGGADDYEFSVVGAPASNLLHLDPIGNGDGGLYFRSSNPAPAGSNTEIHELTVAINDKGLGSELTPPLLTTVRIKYLPEGTPLPPPPPPLPLGLVWTSQTGGTKTTLTNPAVLGAVPPITVSVQVLPAQAVLASVVAGRFEATGGRGNLQLRFLRSFTREELLPFISPSDPLRVSKLAALRAARLPDLGAAFLQDGRVRIEATCDPKVRVMILEVRDSAGGSPERFRIAIETISECAAPPPPPPPPFSDLEAKLAGKRHRDDRNKLNSLLRFGGQEFDFITRGTDDGAPVDLNSVIRTFYVPGEGSTTSGREYVILRDVRFKNGDRDANLIVERGGDRFGLRRTDEGVYEIRFKRGQAYNTGNAHAVLVLRAQNTGGSIVRTEIGVDQDGNRVARLVTTTVAGNPEFAAREPRRYTLRIHTGRFLHFNVHEVDTRTPGGGRLVEGGEFASILYYGGSTLAADTNIADIWVVEGPARSNLGTWVWQVEGGNSKAVAFSLAGSSRLIRRVQIKNGQVPEADNIFRVTVSVRLPNEGNMQATVTVSALVVDPRHADLKAQLGNTTITADLNNPITLSAASATPLTTQILVLQSLGLNLQLLQRGQDEEFTRVNKVGGELEYVRTGTVGNVFISGYQPPGTTLSLILRASDGDGLPNVRGHVDTLRQHRPDRDYAITVVYAAPPAPPVLPPPPPLPQRAVAVAAHLENIAGMRIPGVATLDTYTVSQQTGNLLSLRLTLHALPARLALATVVAPDTSTLRLATLTVVAPGGDTLRITSDLELDGGTLYLPAGTQPSNPQTSAEHSVLTARVVAADVADVLEPTTLTVRARYLLARGRLAAAAENNNGAPIVVPHLLYATGANAAPIAVASVATSGPSFDTASGRAKVAPADLVYAATGDLEVDAGGVISIPADVAPLAPPDGLLLTGAIMVTHRDRAFGAAPTVVSITVRYVLAEPFEALQIKAITSPQHVLGRMDADGNLDTSQRITTFNSHLESFVVSGIDPGDLTRGTSAPLTIAELSIPNAPAETVMTLTSYRTRIDSGVTNTLATLVAVVTVGAQIDIVSRRNIGGIETEVVGGSGLHLIKEGGKTLLINPSRTAYGQLFTATLRVSDTSDSAESRARAPAYHTITAVHMLSVEMDVFGPNLESREVVRNGRTLQVGSGEGVLYYGAGVELENKRPFHQGLRRVALLKPRVPAQTGGRSQLQPDLTRVDTPAISLFLDARVVNIGGVTKPGSVTEWGGGGLYALEINDAARVANTLNTYRNQAHIVWTERNAGAVPRVLPVTMSFPVRNVPVESPVWVEGPGLTPLFRDPTNPAQAANPGRTTLAVTVNRVEGEPKERPGLITGFVDVRGLQALNPAIYYPPGTPRDESMIEKPRTPANNALGMFAHRFTNPLTNNPGHSGGAVVIDFTPLDSIAPDGRKIFYELTWDHKYPGLGPHATRTTEASTRYLWAKIIYQTRPISLAFARTPESFRSEVRTLFRGDDNPYRMAVSRAGQVGAVTLFNLSATGGANDGDMRLSIVNRDGFHIEPGDGRSWGVQVSADVAPNGQTLELVVEADDTSNLADTGDGRTNTNFTKHTEPRRATLQLVYGDTSGIQPRVRAAFSQHRDTRRFIGGGQDGEPYAVAVNRAGELGDRTLFHLAAGNGINTGLRVSIVSGNGLYIRPAERLEGVAILDPVVGAEEAVVWPVRVSANVQPGNPTLGQQILTLIAQVDAGPGTAAALATLRAVYGGQQQRALTLGASFSPHRDGRAFITGGFLSGGVGDGARYTVTANPNELGTLSLFNLGASGDLLGGDLNVRVVSQSPSAAFVVPTTPGRSWPVSINPAVTPAGQGLELVVEITDPAAVPAAPTRATLQVLYRRR